MTIWRIALIAMVATFPLVVFAPACNFKLVNLDDHDYITHNPHVRGGLSADSVAWAFTSTEHANWMPLTWLSLMLDVDLWGGGPAGFHTTNVVLHTLNALLLFAVLVQMTGGWGRSAFVAILFAIHPLHVESVAWVSERKDVLSTLFALLALAAYVKYVRQRGAWWYVPLIAAYALCLMCKQMYVTLPFVLLLLDYWPLQRTGESSKRLVLEKLPLFAMAMAMCIVAFVAQRSGQAMASLAELPLGTRIANAVLTYAIYLWNVVWPVNLAVLYPHPRATFSTAAVICASLLVFGMTVAAIAWRRRHPSLFVGWFWYLGTLVPVIGIVQVGVQQRADRYSYWPLVGIFLAAAWLVPTAATSRAWQRYALSLTAAALVIALSVVARHQTYYWRDSVALFEHALAVNGSNAITERNVGMAMLEAREFEAAIEHFEASLEHDPAAALVHADLADALINGKRFDLAIEHLRESIRLRPDVARTHQRLGDLLCGLDRYAEAVPCYENIVALRPESVSAHLCLADTLRQIGRIDEAVVEYEKSLELNPQSHAARQALEELGRAR